ncbi:MAG TPA: hypothetical protein VGP17_14755 [Solirubrobacteraceae bacterium]|nr:hypothetical protein [Solirubrobacteraceae bacterium]
MPRKTATGVELLRGHFRSLHDRAVLFGEQTLWRLVYDDRHPTFAQRTRNSRDAGNDARRLRAARAGRRGVLILTSAASRVSSW